MTNFKKMALGLLVAVLAVGFSAFTQRKAIDAKAPKAIRVGAIDADYIVQTDEDVFREYLLPGEPDDGECATVVEKECFYHVTELGKNMIDPEPPGGYTSGQIEAFLLADWIEVEPSASPALYNGPIEP